MQEGFPTEQKGLVEYRTHYSWAVIFLTVLCLGLVGRFFHLQILRGEEYERRAQIDHIGRERIPPRRGGIVDRAGRVLARNVSEHSVAVVPHYLERHDQTLPRLRALLRLTHDEYGAIARKVSGATTKRRRFSRLTVMRGLVADRCPHDGNDLVLGEGQSSLWCPACGGRYEPMGRDQRRCTHDRKKLDFSAGGRVGRCSQCGTAFVQARRCPEDGATLEDRTASLICPICKRSFDNQVAIVTSHLHELDGLSVHSVLRRYYPERFHFSHILGYMNEVNRKELLANRELYRPGDYIGRSGLERAIEGLPGGLRDVSLRGTPGEAVYFRDSRGRRRTHAKLGRSVTNLQSRPAVGGDTIWLTVDLGVQKIAQRALRYHPSAAAAVVEVHTGRVLAIYSKPAFDPNVWSGRLTREAKREYDDSPYSPMLNKALTAYAPGSVYKVVTALAALETGVVEPETTLNCPGYYEFGGRRFRCHKHSGHGDMDLVGALKYSCDVYFYKVGEMLGMDRLEDYAHRLFAFGEPTGVEIPERVGRVPSKDWHRKHSRIGWQPGFTLSTAVGQGAVLTSPLQVARAYAAIANGGRLHSSRLVLQVEGEDGTIRRRYMPRVQRELGVAPEHLALVHDSLVQAVHAEDGTAALALLPGIRVAGKTGTAEARQVKRGVTPEIAEWLLTDHAWFAAYAPAEDPQIAVAVFVEHGGSGGKIAAPVARTIIESYFREGYGTLPAQGDASPAKDVDAAADELDGIR